MEKAVNVRHDDGPKIDYHDDGPKIDYQAVRWIPVTERLPEIQKYVLLYGINTHVNEKDYCVGLYWEGDSWYTDSWYTDPEHNFTVTHWMPLPEPPGGE